MKTDKEKKKCRNSDTVYAITRKCVRHDICIGQQLELFEFCPKFQSDLNSEGCNEASNPADAN